MTTLVHADVFFFVTTICVVVLTILLAILIIYLTRVAANLKKFSENAREQGEFIFGELREMAERVRWKSFGASSVYEFIKHFMKRRHV